jgi:D-inositol-3-phosphate glycosyltransferase
LKIIILGSAFPLRGGGISTFNERLCLAFSQLGDEAEIFSFSLQYPNFLFPGKTQYSEEAPPSDIKITSLVNSINPFNWIHVGLKIKKQKPDILVIRYWLPFMAPCLGTIARIVGSNKHTKIIAIADNIIPHEKRFGDSKLSQYFVKSVHAFITMSKSVLKDLEFFDTQKPKLYCPHPLYDNFGMAVTKQNALNSLGLDTSFSYILFFGFIREYKGLDLLLEAVSDIRFSDLNIKLIIAGEYYSDPKPYHEIIEKNKLKNRVVEKTNFIPNDDVVNYFCAADIVVQPYKNATQSGVTQIAYHFDKPMLVTNVGGLPEMIPDGKVGYVVEPNSSAITEALLDFYINKKEAYFTQNVMLEKKKYSWDNLIFSIRQLTKVL